MKNKILFVCRYNRFRSVIAEAFFRKYNKNSNNIVKSAGLIRGNPLSKNVKKIAKKYKLKIKKSPSGLNSKLMMWQNITVIVANDVHHSLFDRNKEYGKKLIVWKVKDTFTAEEKEMNQITSKIEKKVRKLVGELK